MREATAQAKTIFLEALERLGRADMLRYLDQACGDNIALRTRVEELLNAHEDVGSFLEPRRPSLDATVDEPHVVERPGVVVGPYKLMEQIGEGGMGLVFVAEQLHPVRRKVALKLIKPGMDTREVIARFEAERQALALMDHPNIARVFDAGATDSGRPYFVMELVRGVGITEFCDQNRLSPRERLELFVHVCQAVQHAHHKGIIHRDLKSTNILVTLHDGTPVVKVIDFGVAKAVGQRLTEKTIYTGFAQLIGTPMYMSPEQAEMSGLDIDTRSDIYALGVLLYELLTGTMPFDKERLRTAGFDEIRRIIREEEPPRPSTRFSTLGQATATLCANRRSEPARLSQLFRGELDWIVMKALEKDRNRRYDSASAFAADVERYLRDEPVLACPPTLGYRLRKSVRRHRRAALVIALVLLLLVGGIVGTSWGLWRATVEADRKDVALAAALASERNAKDSLWLSLYEQARARRFSRQMGQRLDSLDALTQAAALRPDERLRDAAITAMALPDVRPGATWTPRATGPQPRAWVFDGQYRLYAHVCEDETVSVRTLPDDREILSLAGGPAQLSFLRFSPDSRYLAAFDVHHALQWWRLADGKAVLPEELRQTCGCSFSPDGRQLVVGQHGWLLRFDVATGRELNRWQLPAGRHAQVLAFHPDNNQLAVGYYQATVAAVYDATTGKLLAELPVGGMTEAVVAWDRDGRRLAVTGALVNPVIQIWDVAAKRKVASLAGHVQRIYHLQFHPDGDLLASASWDGVVRLWHLATGRQAMQLPLVVLPQFSNDGRVLGVTFHGERVQLLEVSATREYRTLVSSLGAGQGGYNYDSDVSPDGQLFAQRMNDAVRLWHLPSGRELAVLPPGNPHFQSNGELLIAHPGGLQRWPIQPDAQALRVGPPRVLALPAAPVRAARSRDGRTLALVSEASGAGFLLDLASHAVRTPPLTHEKAGFVALSPDGRWMASSGWHSNRVRLWNAATGALVHEWPQAMVLVFFTPDSRELIICRAEDFTFYDTQTLHQTRRIRRDVALYPGHVAYSPDGTLMALEMAPGVVHLKDAVGGRTVARLEDPHGDRAGWMSFTAEGTQLVVTAPYAQAVHVWDLRTIRQRLKTMNLDWDWPEFRAAPSPAKTARPPRVEVLVGDGQRNAAPAVPQE